MVVDYNGILFQDVGSITQSLWNFHKTLTTYKILAQCEKAPALGYRRKISGTQEEGETKRLINDNHQTFSSLPLFRALWAWSYPSFIHGLSILVWPSFTQHP